MMRWKWQSRQKCDIYLQSTWTAAHWVAVRPVIDTQTIRKFPQVFILRTEILLLVPDDESFCSSKKAFVDFLKVDSLIGIAGQRISYSRAPKSKELVSARFRVETDKVKSQKERYFLLTLECQEEARIDEFNELCDRVRAIGERLSPGQTSINTIWDDVGRLYAEKSYPLI